MIDAPASGRAGPVRLLATAFPTLAVLSLIASFLVVVLGGTVRITGSGLGCPDWPLCYGQLVPPFELEAWIEYIHRLSAATVSLFTGLMVVSAVVRHRIGGLEKGELVLVIVAAGLLVGQVVLGAATVLGEIPPAIAAVHMSTAVAFVGALALIVAGANGSLRSLTAGHGRSFGGAALLRYRWALVGFASFAFLVVVAGTLVTRSGAMAACLGYPLCDTEVTSAAMAQLQDIHMLHRYLAGGLVVYTGIMIWLTLRIPVRPIRGWMAWISAIVFVEALLGAVNVIGGFQEWSRAVHVLFASLVFASIMLLLGGVWRAARTRVDGMQTDARRPAPSAETASP